MNARRLNFRRILVLTAGVTSNIAYSVIHCDSIPPVAQFLSAAQSGLLQGNGSLRESK